MADLSNEEMQLRIVNLERQLDEFRNDIFKRIDDSHKLVLKIRFNIKIR